MPDAVTFDRAAFRAWLDTPNQHGRNGRDEAGLDGHYDSWDDEAGKLVEDTLHALRESPDVWAYGPGVSDVTIWRTADSEGSDGGGTVHVTVDGVELAVGHLQHDDLVFGNADPEGRIQMRRTKAAAMALTQVAAHVNTAVANFRALTGLGGQLVERYVTIHGVTTEEQFRALEAALGHPEGWMGRFKGGHSGIHLDHRDHDCDAAIRWALAHRLDVEQTRTIRHTA